MKALVRMISGTRIETALRAVLGKQKLEFKTSTQYWKDRYKLPNWNSGAGSYGRLAEFKAEILNAFLTEHDIASVIEFGSGDGNQLSLMNYPLYTGVDISPDAVALCQSKFKGDASKTFVQSSNYSGQTADLSLSLDVIYHLIEDEVYHAYMAQVFGAGTRFVGVYASNSDQMDNVLANAAHVRHRKFTDWVSEHAPDWEQVGFVKNKYPYDEADGNNTSFADFYFFAKKGST